MTGSDAYAVFYVAIWLALIAAVARSVWLISWKYLAALYGALALNLVLLSAYIDEVTGYFLAVFVHLGLAYVFYYKFVMREVFLKPVVPALLIEKSRREDLPFGRAFIYIPHLLFAAVIVWFVIAYAAGAFA